MEQLNSKELFGDDVPDFNLFYTQATAVQWMKYIESRIFEENVIQGGIFADSMGHGKTKAMAALMEAHLVNSTLYVGPLSTLHQALNEFATTCKRLNVYYIDDGNIIKYTRLNSGDYQRLKQSSLESPFVLVINKEKMNSDKSSQIINSKCYFRAILDEAHVLRNGQSSQFYNNLLEIRHPTITINGKVRKYCSRFAVTGTPIQNKLEDLINIFKWIDPFLFRNSKIQMEELRSLIRQYLFRRTDDNLTAEMKVLMNFPKYEPEFITVKTEVEKTPFSIKLESLQPKRISEMCKRDSRFRENLSTDERAFTIAASIIAGDKERTDSEMSTFSIQSVLSFPLNQNIFGVTYEGEPYSKVQTVFQILDEHYGESFIIFHKFDPIRDELLKYLRDIDDYHIMNIGGSTQFDKRSKILETCNNFIESGKTVILLLSLKAANEGLNCQSFSNMIFMDKSANPQDESQAARRIYRVGQDKPVKIYSIITEEVSNSNKVIDIDGRLTDIQEEKIPLSTLIDQYNAAWYAKRYTFINSKGERTSGTYFSETFETSGAHDSVGFDEIY